jgi:hypothetical protein
MNLVEYHGEVADGGSGPACARTAGSNLFCNPDGNYTLPPFFYGRPLCVCQDSANNTYNCLRVRNDTADFRFCEFADDVNKVEFFNYVADPFGLVNAAPSLDPTVHAALHERMAEAVACKGSAACNAILERPV